MTIGIMAFIRMSVIRIKIIKVTYNRMTLSKRSFIRIAFRRMTVSIQPFIRMTLNRITLIRVTLSIMHSAEQFINCETRVGLYSKNFIFFVTYE